MKDKMRKGDRARLTEGTVLVWSVSTSSKSVVVNLGNDPLGLIWPFSAGKKLLELRVFQ